MQDTKSIQKLVVFLCTRKEPSEDEAKKLAASESKRIKYLGKNLTKEVQHLYTKHYRTLFKQI